MWNENASRNLRVDAHWDQMEAAKRDNEPLPDGPSAAALARNTKPEEYPESVRDSINELFDIWADEEGVDRP